MNKLGSDQVLDIADRLETLLGKVKSVLPPTILDEEKILRLMFADEGSSAAKSLVMTYLRIEPLIRFCEQELVDAVSAVEEETAKKTTEKAEASDATVSH